MEQRAEQPGAAAGVADVERARAGAVRAGEALGDLLRPAVPHRREPPVEVPGHDVEARRHVGGRRDARRLLHADGRELEGDDRLAVLGGDAEPLTGDGGDAAVD